MKQAPPLTPQPPLKPHHSQSFFAFSVKVLCICTIIFLVFIYIGFQPKPTVINTKLFPLFNSQEYHDLESIIDSNNRVLLLGDDEDGLEIFVDQYINERSEILNIKRREYHYGKNLNYAEDNIFSKGYITMAKAVSHVLKTAEPSQPTLWLLENDGALNLKDINYINEFISTHPEDKFLVTAQVAPSKSSKHFKMIQYQELPPTIVSQHFYNNHKLSKVTATNLLSAYGSNLNKINKIFQHDDVTLKFSQTYYSETEQLAELLLSDHKVVKGFFDKLCKKGIVKSSAPLPFIPQNNNLVRYDNGAYEWKNIKALFAFSGRFNVICNAKLDFKYIPPPEGVTDGWVDYWSGYIKSVMTYTGGNTSCEEVVEVTEEVVEVSQEKEQDQPETGKKGDKTKSSKVTKEDTKKQTVKKQKVQTKKPVKQQSKKSVEKESKKSVEKVKSGKKGKETPEKASQSEIKPSKDTTKLKEQIRTKVESEIKKQIVTDTKKVKKATGKSTPTKASKKQVTTKKEKKTKK